MSDTPGAHPPPPPPPPPGPVPGTDRGVDVTQPPVFDDAARALAPAAVTSWRISAALSAGPPLALLVIISMVFLDAAGWAVLAGAAVLLAVVVGWLQPARYRRWRWQLTEQALTLRYGVLIHIEEHVPYFRIQQIDIAQGPVDRLLGLATLQVTTASASGSATLPGVAADQAPSIRVELLARASRAVAAHPGDVRDAV